jgi:hypothetical protein
MHHDRSPYFEPSKNALCTTGLGHGPPQLLNSDEPMRNVNSGPGLDRDDRKTIRGVVPLRGQ